MAQVAPAPLAIVGATASGKSRLAMELARRQPGAEIVSVDSKTIYRGMDIGTSKPTAAERAEVPHHLLDLAEVSEEFSVQRFQAAAAPVLESLRAAGRRVILVGGTGLYLRSLIDPLSIPGRWPELAAELDADAECPGGLEVLYSRLAGIDPVAAGRMLPTNRRRVVRALEVTLGSGQAFSSFGPGLRTYGPSPFCLVGLRLPREVRARRIAERVMAQMRAGWLDEVRDLAGRPAGLSRTASQALGYRELLAHMGGLMPLEQAVELTVRRTRALAKRQDSWFGRDPRVQWIDADGEDPAHTLEQLERAFSPDLSSDKPS